MVPKWGKGDVREFPRPMGKLHVQADKVSRCCVVEPPDSWGVFNGHAMMNLTVEYAS